MLKALVFSLLIFSPCLSGSDLLRVSKEIFIDGDHSKTIVSLKNSHNRIIATATCQSNALGNVHYSSNWNSFQGEFLTFAKADVFFATLILLEKRQNQN